VSHLQTINGNAAKLSPRGREEYKRFRLNHVDEVETFSALLKMMVVENRVPVEALLDEQVMGQQPGLHDNPIVDKCETAWKSLMAAVDADYRTHPELRDAIKEALTTETRAAGNSLASSIGKAQKEPSPTHTPWR
jgi:hypothetical protein